MEARDLRQDVRRKEAAGAMQEDDVFLDRR